MPDGWSIDLDSVVNISPTKATNFSNNEYTYLYTVGLINGSVMTLNKKELPRESFIDIVRNHK